MIIRVEEERDYDKIREMVKASFAGAEHSDGNEYKLIDKLRTSEGFVKELALVAEVEGEILGHIMFTKVTVGERVGLALAPLAVAASAQKQGVGSKLVTKAHEIAELLGYDFSVVLGSEKYYPRFGYRTASVYGVLAPFEVPDENYMVVFWCEDVEGIRGTVEYVKEFNG